MQNLKFPASLRGSKAEGARNSRFYLKFPTMSWNLELANSKSGNSR